ncbi:MAG: hypothetical protein E6R03_17890 [Hyphomicrobiaceae bacterium]|nr:MAG: hypothetical protein E6R03_17890 [Hyphomicrobiaceae bacterium]
MEAIRTKFIDYDARREPKTDFWCICCQKDIKPGAAHRLVKIVDFPDAIHPDDYDRAISQHGTDVVTHPIGMDCARKLGLEWTVAP